MLELQSQVIGSNLALLMITIWALSNRLGLRLMLTSSWKSHDILISIAAVLAVMMSLFLCAGTHFGLGQHIEDINVPTLISLQKLLIPTNIAYFLCNMFAKHAILAFCTDIMASGMTRPARIAIYVMHIVSFCFGISSVIVILCQCVPFKAIYDPNTPGHCINLMNFNYANGAIMLATDIVLYVLPLILTWDIQLRGTKALGLRCLFALGFFVLIASAARLIVIHRVSQAGDYSYHYGLGMIASAVENHIAIWVACAPSIKSISKRLFLHMNTAYSSFKSHLNKTRRSRSGSVGNIFKTPDSRITSLSPQKDISTGESAPELPSLGHSAKSRRSAGDWFDRFNITGLSTRLNTLIPSRNGDVTELQSYDEASTPQRPPRASFTARNRITVTQTTEIRSEENRSYIDLGKEKDDDEERSGAVVVSVLEREDSLSSSGSSSTASSSMLRVPSPILPM